jgi:peptide/nickel transport system permease protein
VARFILRRLALSLPLLFVVPFLTFVMVALAPGDAARTILGEDFSPEAYDALRHELGLDRPLLVRYGSWLADVLQGDLGKSPITGLSVTDEISSRIWVTASLVVATTLVAALIGIGLGVLSSAKQNRLAKLVDVFSLVGFSLPGFWVGLVLVAIFSVAIGIFPATGYVPFGVSVDKWALGLVLPVAALSFHALAAIAKQTRDAMLDVMSRDYVYALRAHGISERSIVFRHALRNAAIPVSTVVGLLFIGLLDGTVLIESVFAMPGLGGLVVDATFAHDMPVLQGVVVTFTLAVIVVNLIIDIAYGWFNPKARLQ